MPLHHDFHVKMNHFVQLDAKPERARRPETETPSRAVGLSAVAAARRGAEGMETALTAGGTPRRESETNRHVSHVPSQRLQSTARLQTRCALSENVTGLKGRGRRGGHRGTKTHRNRRDRLLFWREGRKWSHHYSSVLFGCNVLIVYVLRECFLAFISYRRLRGMLLLTFGNFAHAHNDAVCCGRIIPLKWNQDISYY